MGPYTDPRTQKRSLAEFTWHAPQPSLAPRAQTLTPIQQPPIQPLSFGKITGPNTRGFNDPGTMPHYDRTVATNFAEGAAVGYVVGAVVEKAARAIGRRLRRR